MTQVTAVLLDFHFNLVRLKKKPKSQFSVFYRNKQKFVARRDPKCVVTGKESIYHVNVPYLVFKKRVAAMDMFTRSLARSFIPSGWGLIQKHSIEEVIWGYTDPVLERLKTFGQTDQTVFGFFMNQNESRSFEIEAISGKERIKFPRKFVGQFQSCKLKTYLS